MNGSSCRSLRVVFIAVLSMGLAGVMGCGSNAPDEANAALDTALKALAAGDTAGFTQKVLPDQRSGIEGKKEWDFLTSVKSHEIDNEFDMHVTDTTSSIATKLLFDDEKKLFSNLRFFMAKSGDAWYIDLDKTIKTAYEINSVHAFQVWEWGKQ